MNCPKCGSENIKVENGLILCRECGYARPEPTTAEMLVWIAKNLCIVRFGHSFLELESLNIMYCWIEYKDNFPFYIRDGVEVIFVQDFEKAVQAAYNKEQK